MNVSRTSWLLVVIQAAAVIALAITGPLLPRAYLPASFIVAGGGLGLWALFAIPLRRLRIFPEPADDAKLAEKGPYKWIRHPMYASVLLIAMGWLLARFTYARLAVFILLAMDLMLKLHREEAILKKSLPGYADYMRRTHRLIPYVF